MTDHETVLADIDVAYLEICGYLDTVELGDKLLKLKRLAEEAVLHPCSRPKAIDLWNQEN